MMPYHNAYGDFFSMIRKCKSHVKSFIFIIWLTVIVAALLHTRKGIPSISKLSKLQPGTTLERELAKPNKRRNSNVITYERKTMDNTSRLALRSDRPRSMKSKITAYFMGRLGNLMFQYASLYGIATGNNMTPEIYPLLLLRNVFNLSAKTHSSSTDWTVVQVPAYEYDSSLMNISLSTRALLNIQLEGYLQSWRYFQQYQKEIRSEFQFKNRLLVTARMEFLSVVSVVGSLSGTIFIGVHVRRGDIVDMTEMKEAGHVPADLAYIVKAMKYFRSKFRNTLFVVSSNDLQWCKSNLKFRDVVFLRKHSDPVLDMCILTQCNHTIMTVGTFGWWTAWLTGGETVYYHGYPRIGSELASSFNRHDYYPPSWIPM